MDKKYLNYDLNFKLQLLARMKSDCEYYLDGGNKQVKYLWSGAVDDQIADMKELLFSIRPEERPDWLTLFDIEIFSGKMDHRKVITAETLGLGGARYIDIFKRPANIRENDEIFFSIEGKKRKEYEAREYGYIRMTSRMQEIFDSLIKANPNKSIEFIEWDDSWNAVFHDGIHISSRMCRMEKSEFAEWERTIKIN